MRRHRRPLHLPPLLGVRGRHAGQLPLRSPYLSACPQGRPIRSPPLPNNHQGMHELHLCLQADDIIQGLTEQGEAMQGLPSWHELPEQLQPPFHHPPGRHCTTSIAAARRRHQQAPPLPPGAAHPVRPPHYLPAPDHLPAHGGGRPLVAAAAHDTAHEVLVARLRRVPGDEGARPWRRAAPGRRHRHVGGELHGVPALPEAHGLGREAGHLQAQQELLPEGLLEPSWGMHCCMFV